MAQQYLVDNCLNTGGAGVIQGLTTSIINIAPQGVSTEEEVGINTTAGPMQEGGYIDFLSIPNASRGRISIVQNALVLQSGDDGGLENGTISIPTLFIEQGRLLGSTTNLIGNADANVFVSMITNADIVNLVQNTTNQLDQNKTIFTYPFQAGIPHQIRFTSDLFKLGMVFLKDESGLNNIPGVTMELDLTQDPPLLTITNIPFNEAGFCNAMLFVI